MPAVTPRLPDPKGVNFQQFCDQLWTDLPGDHHGKGSFDTSASFVVGDPGARFGSAAPLEYEVTEEIGRPHWELIFEHVLRHCGYLIEFHTVYVMVDNRDLANHKRQDSSLPHWPAAARWWHVRPLPTCCDCSCAAFPVVAAPESMSASSAGDSVGERLIYWSSRRGFMRDGRIHLRSSQHYERG